jgi:hypothetical protein
MNISPIALQKINHLLTQKTIAISAAANYSSMLIPTMTEVTPQLIDDLRRALSAWRADDYDDWIRVANALHSLGDIGFKIWMDWSRQSSKYDEQEAAKKKMAAVPR